MFNFRALCAATVFALTTLTTPFAPGAAASAHPIALGPAVAPLPNARPPQENICNPNSPNVSYGSWWVESSGVWYYYQGLYTQNNGGPRQPCPGALQEECTPGYDVNCPPYYWWWMNEVPWFWTSAKDSFVATLPTQGVIVITQIGKKSVTTLATLTTSGPMTAAATPVGVAVDPSGPILASVFTSNSVTQPYVYEYAAGATSPTGVLTDPASTGTLPAGIAVDKAHDVYWAFDTPNSGAGTIQVDVFPRGSSKPVVFAKIPGGNGGALLVTKKNLIVASSPSTGMIYMFYSNGKLAGSFATKGSPDAISIDSANKNLYVEDTTAATISQFAFPSGQFIASTPVQSSTGQPLNIAGFQPHAPQLP